MVSSPEDQVKEEIRKAQGWYGKTYKKSFVVQQRYDKQEKHFSWRIIAEIGGKERAMQIGMTQKMAESPLFPMMKARILDHIKQTLIKAQVKWEPQTKMII